MRVCVCENDSMCVCVYVKKYQCKRVCGFMFAMSDFENQDVIHLESFSLLFWHVNFV